MRFAMGKYFTEEELDAFVSAYLDKYPDAIERMHFAMTHPFRDNGEQMARKAREVREVAETMPFYHEYANKLKRGGMRGVQDPYYHAYYNISEDLAQKVAGMLGPIGSYKIEE